jgi:hypothetical protein
MSEEKINASQEQSYERGRREATVSMVRSCLRSLGYKGDEAERVKWIAEREETVATLRSACEEFGDNDWSNDLHLSDVIDKHLVRPILRNREQ